MLIQSSLQRLYPQTRGISCRFELRDEALRAAPPCHPPCSPLPGHSPSPTFSFYSLGPPTADRTRLRVDIPRTLTERLT